MAANHITQQAPNKRFRMFDTAESAGLWFDIFSGVLLLGAFFVLLGTWGTIKTGAIKEKFSDERVEANEAETKRAIADSDIAKEGTAKANERIAELSTRAEELRRAAAESNAALGVAQADIAKANEHAATLAIELERAKNDAKQIDANLLNEQRLTARERLRLERIERAVLPRRINFARTSELVSQLKGLGPLNIAVVDGLEPELFAEDFLTLFRNAEIMGSFIKLPAGPPRLGVTAYLAGSGVAAAAVLTQVGLVAGTISGITPTGLEILPKDQTTIVIGENDWRFRGADGQPGEGADEHGRPVPAPQ
jgi:hypothetical protein